MRGVMALTDQRRLHFPGSISLRASFSSLELALAGAIFVVFVPTLIRLINGPWQTEQEGHGPIVIAAAAWLAWQARRELRADIFKPAYVAGWIVLLSGLGLLIVMRSQDVLMLEVVAQIPIISGAVLLASGWRGLRAYAFPIAFLVFAVPPPGWMMDAFTVPLKLMVSDWVADTLYRLGYPIAQNGVMIMIGAYQLMVKDACSGMNSIFALTAIGVFYMHEFIRQSPFRKGVMLASIVPITVAANFVRVLVLVLMAYYAGIDAVEGLFHDLTGFLLFVIALMLFFTLDGVLIAAAALVGRAVGEKRPSAEAP